MATRGKVYEKMKEFNKKELEIDRKVEQTPFRKGSRLSKLRKCAKCGEIISSYKCQSCKVKK